MDFEQALAAILDYVGGEVTVHVFASTVPFSTDSGGANVLRMTGMLSKGEGRAERLSLDYEREEDASDLFFSVGSDGGGFFLNPELFVDALPLSDDVLAIRMPGVVLHLARGRLVLR